MSRQPYPTTDLFIRNLIQAWNNHDVDAAAACYAPDFYGMNVAEAEPRRGPASVRQKMTIFFTAFLDLQFGMAESVVQESQVAVHWIASGTHQGVVMNIPPTGPKITVAGSSFFTIGDGKIKRETTIWDVAGMLRGIGLLPEL
jgi:steroid delta-isomerase-like uncharacterized protein